VIRDYPDRGWPLLIVPVPAASGTGHSRDFPTTPAPAPGREVARVRLNHLSQPSSSTGGILQQRAVVGEVPDGLSPCTIGTRKERIDPQRSHLAQAHDVGILHPTVPGWQGSRARTPQGDRKLFPQTAGGPRIIGRDPVRSPISVCAPGYSRRQGPQRRSYGVDAGKPIRTPLSSRSGPDRARPPAPAVMPV